MAAGYFLGMGERSELERVAAALGAPGKGILAMDESTPTITKRLAAIGVESTPETNHAYRDTLLTAPGFGEFISGVIFYEETLRQSTIDGGVPYPEFLRGAGVVPGIKVDRGAKALAGAPGEKVTEGLDGLRERFAEYYGMGARFAKWRAVISIDGDGIPSARALAANAHALARYAALAQEAGLVPICEPEVLMDGNHGMARSAEVTGAAITALYAALREYGVLLEGTVLKPNMVVPGYDGDEEATPEAVAAETLACFRRCVPAAVPSIVFLSGGQSEEEAAVNLAAINRLKGAGTPWNLSFSFGRALQQSALKTWGGEAANREAAQGVFMQRAKAAGLATLGKC